MFKPIKAFITTIGVLSLTALPLATGSLLLSADAAIAKSAKNNGSGKVKADRKNKKNVSKASKEKEKSNLGRQKVAVGNQDENSDSLQAHNKPKREKDNTDTQAGQDAAVYGNPGNDKEVGRAGETSNGDTDGWGSGGFGRSDAETFDVEADDSIRAEDILDPEELFEQADDT